MNWNEQFAQGKQPDLSQIGAFVGSPLWEALCAHLKQVYGTEPRIEYSRCSGAPGWNVKYKKGSRALCTLYPNAGFFTCLVSLGGKEAEEAELLLDGCTEYVRDLYRRTKPFNGARWLMIDVTSADILEDAERLIALRANSKR